MWSLVTMAIKGLTIAGGLRRFTDRKLDIDGKVVNHGKNGA